MPYGDLYLHIINNAAIVEVSGLDNIDLALDAGTDQPLRMTNCS
jgi:hypothetical protein